jgi:hypothetical protein
MPSRERFTGFTAWSRKQVIDDEKGEVQIFLERFFQAFGQAGSPNVVTDHTLFHQILDSNPLR